MKNFRDYPEQFEDLSRKFKCHDQIVFVGPPDDKDNMTFVARPMQHKLYLKKGLITFGPNESIRCYPDENFSTELGRMFWVKFEDDNQPIRQVDGTWIVKDEDFNWDGVN